MRLTKRQRVVLQALFERGGTRGWDPRPWLAPKDLDVGHCGPTLTTLVRLRCVQVKTEGQARSYRLTVLGVDALWGNA